MVTLAFEPDLHFTYVEAYRINVNGANGASYYVQVPVDLPKRSVWIFGEHEFTAVVFGKVRAYHNKRLVFSVYHGNIGTASQAIANCPMVCEVGGGATITKSSFAMDYPVGGFGDYVKRYQFVASCDTIGLELDPLVTNCGHNPWFYDIIVAVMSEKIW